MGLTGDLNREICSLFEVYSDFGGVQRIVTPLLYPGSSDHVVIRVRTSPDGFIIDENGEAAFSAGLAGGDILSDAVDRWAEELINLSPVSYDSNEETLSALANEERLIAPYIFRVAEAAQQLHAIATARPDRQASDFKERVRVIVEEIALQLDKQLRSDIELPIAGGLKADHVVGGAAPLIIIAATSATRLLEAEVIFMQYRAEHKPGYVLAIAESQQSVGKKQYERAAYYTDKAVIFNSGALRSLLSAEMYSLH